MHVENKILVDQFVIRKKIKKYLEFGRRNEDFIEQLDKGYRSGVAFLWLYIRWLQTQPAQRLKTDYAWFKSVIKLINKWNIRNWFQSKEIFEIEKFVSLIGYFQHIAGHSPVNQNLIKESIIENTLKDAKNKSLEKEYSIASLLILEQLKQLLKTKNIIQNNKLILINSHNHTTALFKEEEKYYYFDPNNRAGEVQVDSTDEIAKLIFDANFYTVSGRTYKILSTRPAYVKPSPLGFRMFSFYEKHAKYPSQNNVLDSIGPALIPEENYADEYSGLALASTIGSLESAQYFLEKGVNPNRKTSNGWTAVMLASRYGYSEIVKILLIHQDIDLNVQNGNRYIALMLASEHGNFDVVDALLTNPNIDPNKQDKDGRNALMLASIKGHLNIVKVLLQHIDPNEQNKYGCNALIWASTYGHLSIVKELINQKADPNRQRVGNWTPLMCAAWWNHVDIVKELLDQGTDPNRQDEYGSTALILASGDSCLLEEGHRDSDVVTTLLTHPKIDLNVQNKDGYTALMLAVLNGNVKIVKELLDHHKNINPNLRDKKSRTALIMASTHPKTAIATVFIVEDELDHIARMQATDKERLDISKVLLAHPNIDPNIGDEYGLTALMWASVGNYLDIVKELLAHPNIDLNAKDKYGLTTFMCAAYNEHLDIVKVLLARQDLDVNMQDEEGMTAFMLASRYGRLDAVKELLTHSNIDINKQTKRGWNALMYASFESNFDVVKELLKHGGINSNIQDKDGKTAFDYATLDEIKNLLQEYKSG